MANASSGCSQALVMYQSFTQVGSEVGVQHTPSGPVSGSSSVILRRFGLEDTPFQCPALPAVTEPTT